MRRDRYLVSFALCSLHLASPPRRSSREEFPGSESSA